VIDDDGRPVEVELRLFPPVIEALVDDAERIASIQHLTNTLHEFSTRREIEGHEIRHAR
jgi:hypothetical protein